MQRADFHTGNVHRNSTTSPLQFRQISEQPKNRPTSVEQRNTTTSFPMFHHLLKELNCCNKSVLLLTIVSCLGMKYAIYSRTGVWAVWSTYWISLIFVPQFCTYWIFKPPAHETFWNPAWNFSGNVCQNESLAHNVYKYDINLFWGKISCWLFSY